METNINQGIQGDRRQESGDRITYIPFIGANGR